MRILVIDDQRIFKSFPNLDEIKEEDEVVQVTTSQEGVAHLYLGYWDEVWLDHDMGMESDMNGTDLVNFIESKFYGDYGDERLPDVGAFYVHSSNPIGSERMVTTLAKLGLPTYRMYDPYPYLDYDAMKERGRNPWLAGPNR